MYPSQIGVDKVPHFCSLFCSTHLQPTFDELVYYAQDALEKLFQPASVLRYIHSQPPRLPTEHQLLNAMIVGHVQFKLCFSCHLLSEEQRAKVHPPFIMSFFSTMAACLLFLRKFAQPSLSTTILPGDRWWMKGPNFFDGQEQN